MEETMRSPREKLPDDRDGMTHHFTIIVPNEDGGGGTHEVDGYIQTGLYEDGRVGEVFVKVGKAGSTFAAIDQWAIAFSFALQHGADLETLCRKFVGARFEPFGATRSKDIPRCSSLIDYSVRWLLHKYGRKEGRS